MTNGINECIQVLDGFGLDAVTNKLLLIMKYLKGQWLINFFSPLQPWVIVLELVLQHINLKIVYNKLLLF